MHQSQIRLSVFPTTPDQLCFKARELFIDGEGTGLSEAMTDTKIQPGAHLGLRKKFFNDVLGSLLGCTATAALFLAIDFGTGSSPSVPHLLVTVTLPALMARDCISCMLAKRTVGFFNLNRSWIWWSDLVRR